MRSVMSVLSSVSFFAYALSVWAFATQARAFGSPAQAAETKSPPLLEVHLPPQVEPIPEPLPAGTTKPGFEFRGMKGWVWTPKQYLEEIPTLRALKMNFLMNCYGSMFTSAPGQPWLNEWWKPMTAARKKAYARVIQMCRENGIVFCFAFHPQIASPRPLNPASIEDINQFYRHYDWAQSQGVHWFSVSLDDVGWGGKGPAQAGATDAHLVNTIIERLRVKDPGAQMIFCPGPYWGDGTAPNDRAYLSALGRDLDPKVYIFWTGDGVIGPRITLKAAESYKAIVNHRLFLWDNYPVNDGGNTLNLGPVRGRDPELCKVIDGYISNPMATQNEINRIPLATCADYAYNPYNYDPNRSIGRAIMRLARTRPQQIILKQLVETYPGFLVTGGGTQSNPVRTQFTTLLTEADGRTAALRLLNQIQGLLAGLDQAFPSQFVAAKQTVRNDITWMQRQVNHESSAWRYPQRKASKK